MKKLLAIAIAAVLLTGCASTSVNYVDPTGVDTTSIGFNSTDLQTTTQKMIDEMLSSKAIYRITANKEVPILFFSGIKNETNEHINTKMLENTVSTRLINSGDFQFTDMSQVKNVKEQIDYQNYSGMVSQNDAIKMGQQVGAKYMMYGSIANINASNSSQQSNFFLITLKLMDVQKGVIIWQGEKQIRKIQKRSTFGW